MGLHRRDDSGAPTPSDSGAPDRTISLRALLIASLDARQPRTAYA
jgi:hypothetical protein